MQIYNTRVWSEDPFRFLHKGNMLLNTCIEILELQYNDMSTVEFYDFYRQCEPANLIFNAPMGHVSEYYYSIDMSVDILHELLAFQFDKEPEAIKDFLKWLLWVCDKRVQKLNTLMIEGSANSGKNYFFDCVLHYYINWGQMGNFNKFQNFPLQGCMNKRIILSCVYCLFF
uniref:Non-capsid protein NS-1 n=1 Tax=Cacopsylla melanoneura TaxID=428564 RepID=A0A8D8VXJ9_9HEMI